MLNEHESGTIQRYGTITGCGWYPINKKKGTRSVVFVSQSLQWYDTTIVDSFYPLACRPGSVLYMKMALRDGSLDTKMVSL
jgi:hypothetical protein